MTRILNKLRKYDDGSAAVEFSLALPVIMLLTFGFFEFCLVLFTQGVLDSSAEEATRYAMVNFEQDNLDADYITGIKSDIKAVAKDSFIMIDESKISDFDVEVITNNSDATKTVSISIDYEYSLSMPFIDDLTFTMTGSSESFLVQ